MTDKFWSDGAMGIRFFDDDAPAEPQPVTEPTVKASPFRHRAKMLFGIKDQTGGTCKVGERSDLTGCTPRNKKPAAKKPSIDREWELRQQQRQKPKQKPKQKPQAQEESITDDIPVKRRAEKGKLVSAARIVGEDGKAKIVLKDGTDAPEHIQLRKIPPTWSSIKVSMDPNADLQVSAKVKNKRGKMVKTTIYHEKFKENNKAAKFACIKEGLEKYGVLGDEIQKDRSDNNMRNSADCAWLMREQGTRVGGEADRKGLEHLYGQPITKDSIKVKKGEKILRGAKKGQRKPPTVQMIVNGEKVEIQDEKAKDEIIRRINAGEDLMDSTFWLKSHGATTLEARHVVETPEGVRLQFMGKKTVWHNHLVKNPELAQMLLERKKAAGNPMDMLFGIGYAEAFAYVHKLDGGHFTPHNLRTMLATRMAIAEINNREAPTKEGYEQAVKEIGEKVSGVLGNDWKEALESYIAPEVWSVWRSADMEETNAA